MRIFQNGPLAEVKKALKKKQLRSESVNIGGERERGKNQSFPQKRPENGH